MSSSGLPAASASASASASTSAASAAASTSAAGAAPAAAAAASEAELPTHFVNLRYLDGSTKKGWLKQLLVPPRGASALPPLRPDELAPLRELLNSKSWFDAGHPFLESAGCPHVQLYLARSAETLQAMLFISRAHVERLARHASVAMRAHQPGAWARELHIPPSRPGTWEREELVSIAPVAPRNEREVWALRGERTEHALSSIEAAQPDGRNHVTWPTAYEMLRTLWQHATLPGAPVVPLLLAIDVETWDLSHRGSPAAMRDPANWALEIGWSLISPSTPRAGTAPAPWSQLAGDRRPMMDVANPPPPGIWMQETHHYIVDKHFPSRRNGRYCPDQRHNFLFGPDEPRSGAGQEAPYGNGSRIASLDEIAGELNTTLQLACDTDTPVFVVFHAAAGDLATLQQMGIPTRSWLRGPEGIKTMFNWLPGVARAPVCVLDTALLVSTLRGDKVSEPQSLSTVALALNVNDGVIEGMHNAANDAFYTAAVCAMMAAGPPMLELRELLLPRWPMAKALGRKRAAAWPQEKTDGNEEQQQQQEEQQQQQQQTLRRQQRQQWRQQMKSVMLNPDEHQHEEYWRSPWRASKLTSARAVTDELASRFDMRALRDRLKLSPADAQAEHGSATSASASTSAPRASAPPEPLVEAAVRRAAASAREAAQAKLMAQAKAERRVAARASSRSQPKAGPQPNNHAAAAAVPSAPPSPKAPAPPQAVPQSRITQGKLYARNDRASPQPEAKLRSSVGDASAPATPAASPPPRAAAQPVAVPQSRIAQGKLHARSNEPPPLPVWQAEAQAPPLPHDVDWIAMAAQRGLQRDKQAAAYTQAQAEARASSKRAGSKRKPLPPSGIRSHSTVAQPAASMPARSQEAALAPTPGSPHAASNQAEAAAQPIPAATASSSSSPGLQTWPAPISRTLEAQMDALLDERLREGAALAEGVAEQHQRQSASPLGSLLNSRSSKHEASSSPPGASAKQRAKVR